MPLHSRWLPIVTVLTFGVTVGGITERILAGGVAAILLGAVLLWTDRQRFLPLAAVGALLGAGAGSLVLRPVPGGYALADAKGSEVFRAHGPDARHRCLERAAARGAVRV